jgi:hypothetical protein
MRTFAIAVLMFLVPQIAAAADWRYCIAPSHAEHKVYMTAPFFGNLATDDAESELAQTLSRSGLRYDDVQCPQGDDEATLATMQQHAIAMNRDLGVQIVNLRWRPGR